MNEPQAEEKASKKETSFPLSSMPTFFNMHGTEGSM